MAKIHVSVDYKRVIEQIERRIEDGVEDGASKVGAEMKAVAKEKVRRKNAIWNKDLIRSFEDSVFTVGDRTFAEVSNVSDHASPQEYGVNGVSLARGSKHSYKAKRPPIEPLLPWVRDNLAGTGFSPSGFGSGPGGSGGSGGSTPTTDLVRPAGRDGTDEPETISVSDWSDWEPYDSRFWRGQSVSLRDPAGNEYGGTVTDYDGDRVYGTFDDGTLPFDVAIGSDSWELTEYQNWFSLNPIQKRQQVFDEIIDVGGEQVSSSDPINPELLKVYANWVAYSFFDSVNDESVIRRYLSSHRTTGEYKGAGVKSTPLPGYEMYLRQSYEASISDNPVPETDRGHWVGEPVLWHESKHALAVAAGYDTHDEGTTVAKRFNKRDFAGFMNNMPPLAFDSDGNPTNKWDGWNDVHKHAKYHMFEKREYGQSSLDIPDTSDLLGWNDWKDDIELVEFASIGEVEPSDWMPTNGDPVLNVLEAANRSWWKQALTITNDDDVGGMFPAGFRSHATSFIAGYSATHAHETLAMASEQLHRSSTTLDDLEEMYRLHPWLVKTLLYLEGADPDVLSKLAQLADTHDFTELKKYL